MAIIAILSDVHSNFDALTAVLKRAEELHVEYYIILGDTIGYYFDSEKVIDRILDLPATVIAGNHERMFLDGLTSKSARLAYKKKYGASFDLAYKTLSDPHVEWIKKLKFTARLNKYSNIFDVCHGAPWDCDAYIYPDAPRSALEACLDANVTFTLTGHTHYSMMKRISASQILINPGSVGQPRDLGGYASWCTISLNDKNISFHRTHYSLERILRQCEHFDPNNSYLREVLTR